MKLRAFIVLSIGMNVVLAAILVWRPVSGKRAAPLAPVSAPHAVKKNTVQSVTNTETVTLPDRVVNLDWRTVESSDFKEYIARLRAIGCPEETIRDIIIADVSKLYASKWKSLMLPEGGIRYWDPWDSTAEYYDRKIASQRRELEQEKKALIQELLGVDVDQELRKQQLYWSTLDREESLLGFLSEDKRRQVQAIANKTRDMNRAVYDRVRFAGFSQAVRDELTKVREWSNAELRKVLTPSEYDQYSVRLSDTARTVRSLLTGFEPTETEYLAVFRAQSEFQESFKPFTMGERPDPEEIRRRNDAAREMDARLRQQLGDRRFEEYKRAASYEYREFTRVVQEQGLPKDVANKAYDVSRLANEQAAKLGANNSLGADERQAALQAIQAETQKTLSTLLGPDAYKSFMSRSGFLFPTVGRPAVVQPTTPAPAR